MATKKRSPLPRRTPSTWMGFKMGLKPGLKPLLKNGVFVMPPPRKPKRPNPYAGLWKR